MTAIVSIVLVGLGTYACRAVFILVFADRKIPASLQRMLQYVAPATLSALVMTFLINEEGFLLVGNPELAGLLSAAVIAYVTRNHIYTLAAGLATLLILTHWL